MLANAISCVDDRHAGMRGGDLSGSRHWMPQDDDVSIGLERPYGVRKRLAFSYRRSLQQKEEI